MKGYRDNEMKWLAILYAVLFLYFSTDFVNIISKPNNSEISLIKDAFESVFTTFILPIIVYIFDCLFTSKSKNWLLGSCIKKPYGYTIFSDISSGKFKDERVSIKTARCHYNDIISLTPKDKKSRYLYENEQWYKIYSQYESNKAVIQTQKDWLACRDMYIETILFGVFYLLTIPIFNGVSFSLNLTLIIIAMSIIFNVCAHIKMKRFVNTVIVKDILNTKN